MQTFTRRAFLRHASASASLLGAGSTRLAAQSRDGDLEALASELTAKSAGRVVLPGEAAHAKIKYYNARFDCLRDTAYIRPTSDDGVRLAIEWANRHERKFAIRGAGHSFEGKSSHASLVIDMSQMSKHTFRDGMLDVEAGVQLGPVYDTLAAAGHILAAGTCPTVGLIGHALGGGIGDFLPMFGYAAQSLRTVRLVTMHGTYLKVSDDDLVVLGGPALPTGAVEAAELMRALRGGGQGSFGVVTGMTFEPVDVRRAKIANFKLEVTGEIAPRRAAVLLQAWFDWRRTLPPAMQSVVSAKLNLSRSGGGFGLDIAGLIVVPADSGVDVDDVRRSLDQLFEAQDFGKKIFQKNLDAKRAVKTFLDDDETTTNSKRKMLYGSSGALERALPAAAIRHLVQNLRSDIFASFYTSGGRTKSAPLTSLHASEFLIEWSTYAQRRTATAHRRIRDLHTAVVRIAGQDDRAFPNYPDSDDRNYFPEQEKLRTIRAALDPAAASTSSLLTPSPPTDSGCR